MEFKELSTEEISDFIMNDPVLISTGFRDDELVEMHLTGKYPLHPGSFYIGIMKDDVLIGILRWEYFTERCISIHPYISSKLRGQRLSVEMSDFVIDHLEKNTEVDKVVAFIIEPCKQAIAAVQRCGFKEEGFITDCITWRKEPCGMYIYGRTLQNKYNKNEVK